MAKAGRHKKTHIQAHIICVWQKFDCLLCGCLVTSDAWMMLMMMMMMKVIMNVPSCLDK